MASAALWGRRLRPPGHSAFGQRRCFGCRLSGLSMKSPSHLDHGGCAVEGLGQSPEMLLPSGQLAASIDVATPKDPPKLLCWSTVSGFPWWRVVAPTHQGETQGSTIFSAECKPSAIAVWCAVERHHCPSLSQSSANTVKTLLMGKGEWGFLFSSPFSVFFLHFFFISFLIFFIGFF